MSSLVFVLALLGVDEPVRCSNLDWTEVSIIAGRVEQVTQSRTEQRSGFSPFDWTVEFETTVVIQPLRTLRGAPVAARITLQEGCSTPWLDFGGRRHCADVLARGSELVVQTNRRTGETSRNPDRDLVADHDRRVATPMPRC